MEIAWTGLGSFLRGEWQLVGRTYLWMLPIYGLGIVLEPIHDRIRHLPWYLRGFVWVGAIFGVEAITGTILRVTVGICPWDYSRTSYSALGGAVRLDYAPLWFGVGLGFERLHDFLDQVRVLFRP